MHLPEIIARQCRALENYAPTDLKNLLQHLSGLKDQLPLHVSEPGALPYGRNVLYSDDNVEVIAILLPPHRQTAIHDHGDSQGCALIVEGVMTNTVYERINNRLEAAAVREETVDPGGLLSFPPGMIHCMSNRSHGRVLSLHAYSPPLKGMRVYREAQRQFALDESSS